MNETTARRVLLIGGSAGSLGVLSTLCAQLPVATDAAVVLCLHTASRDSRDLCAVLGQRAGMPVREAIEHGVLAPGVIHVASGDYHLLVERERRFALSYDEPVHFCRPSIDVLFESAAEAFRGAACGLLLSGANQDGAAGLARLQRLGATTFVQTPESCMAPQMPGAALACMTPDASAPPATLARYVAPWLLGIEVLQE